FALRPDACAPIEFIPAIGTQLLQRCDRCARVPFGTGSLGDSSRTEALLQTADFGIWDGQVHGKRGWHRHAVTTRAMNSTRTGVASAMANHSMVHWLVELVRHDRRTAAVTGHLASTLHHRPATRDAASS